MPFRKVVTILMICLVATATAQSPGTPGQAPYLVITSTPPKDLKANATLEEAAKFAWQEFLALQWKASIDSTHAPGVNGNERGLPDPNWNHSMPTPKFPDPLVWQTYAQTTELRPNGPLTRKWRDLGLPQYSYYMPPVQGNQIISGGGGPPFRPPVGPANNLWNNLDEDSEIGSCNLYGQYQQQPNPKELVLFQVKVNRDEYEYIRTRFGKEQHCAGYTIVGPQGSKKLVPNPGTILYGSCEDKPDGGALAQLQQAVAKNIKQPPYLYYPGQKSRCDCEGKAICLPCGSNVTGTEGAIEVKSAWRRLRPGEDPKRFYTTTALYYDVQVTPSKIPGGPSTSQLAYFNDTFALIGMHIIHKTENYPEFIFATFEQVDVEGADMEYILTTPVSALPGTEVPGPVPVKRQSPPGTNKTQLHPVPETLTTVTSNVWAQLKALNPSTPWQYYRLTGVQARPVDVPVPLKGVTPTAANCIAQQDPIVARSANPNYFMANFVIESDPFLNNFTGPGFGNNGGPIFTPGMVRGRNLTKTNGCENVVVQQPAPAVAGVPVTAGGCQACHGVSQTAFGTDFSFLLDFGHNKPSIMPAALHYNAPAPAPPPGQASDVLTAPLDGQSVGQARRAFRSYMDGTRPKSD